MYILPGSIELGQVPASKVKVTELVQAAGAAITSEFDMERRRLAYPINKEGYGYYHVMQFDAEPSVIKALDAKIRLENLVLRFIITKCKPMTAEQIKTMVAGEQYKKQRPQPEVVVAAVKSEQTSATALSEAEMEFAKSTSSKHVEEVEAIDQKVSIEELDKKLDAILEDTDLDKKL
jgi:small subunit ribosomal protein S6